MIRSYPIRSLPRPRQLEDQPRSSTKIDNISLICPRVVPTTQPNWEVFPACVTSRRTAFYLGGVVDQDAKGYL